MDGVDTHYGTSAEEHREGQRRKDEGLRVCLGWQGLVVKLVEVRVVVAGCRRCKDHQWNIWQEKMLLVQQQGQSSTSVTRMGLGKLNEDLDECTVKHNSWAAQSSAKNMRAAWSSMVRDFGSTIKQHEMWCGQVSGAEWICYEIGVQSRR